MAGLIRFRICSGIQKRPEKTDAADIIPSIVKSGRAPVVLMGKAEADYLCGTGTNLHPVRYRDS
jgi:hypothetical protein